MDDIFHSALQKNKADDRADGAERPPGLTPGEAGALSQDSRRRMAQALAVAPDGLSVAQLAERLDLHQNAVRQHLRVLQRAGVVVAAPAPPTGRRGRPSVHYRLAAPHGVEAVGHRELVRLLLEMVRLAGFSEETAREFGRERGAGLLEVDASQGAEAVGAAMAGLGFAPEEVAPAGERGAGRRDLRLRSCPFRDAVLAPGGELICALHHGLVEGALQRVAPEARLAEFRVEEPVRAGCRVLIEGAGPPDGG